MVGKCFAGIESSVLDVSSLVDGLFGTIAFERLAMKPPVPLMRELV